MILNRQCEGIELILSDVDGVMTDGGLIFDNQGNESKQFHIRDGLAVKLWQQAGYKFGIITGRRSNIVQRRAAELEIELIRQGNEEKLSVVQEILDELNLGPEQTCYLGDDLLDLPSMKHVGLAVAVADACSEVREAAHLVTKAPGGHGAVREAIELILKAKGQWKELITKYTNP